MKEATDDNITNELGELLQAAGGHPDCAHLPDELVRDDLDLAGPTVDASRTDDAVLDSQSSIQDGAKSSIPLVVDLSGCLEWLGEQYRRLARLVVEPGNQKL